MSGDRAAEVLLYNGAALQFDSEANLIPPEDSQRAFAPENIAYPLSRIPRYGGHTQQLLHVSDHSIFVCETLERNGESEEVQLFGLLHDSDEIAFPGDVISPIKRNLSGPALTMQRNLRAAILRHYGLEPPIPDAVREVDSRIVLDEIKRFLHPDCWEAVSVREVIDSGLKPLGIEFPTSMWSAAESRARFKMKLRQLCGA